MRGTWFILPTAFRADGSIDVESQASLVDLVISWGVDGITAMGMMAEPTSLDDAERAAVLNTIFDRARGRVPVAIGCSATSPILVHKRVAEAEELGAAAVMVSPPLMLSNIDLLPSFYAEIAGRTALPLIVQDEPVQTAVKVPVSVLRTILEVSGARIVKLEDPPTASKLRRLLELLPGVMVFGGLGGLYALEELKAGAAGTMTGFAYPEVLVATRQLVDSGDHQGAGFIFDKYLPLIRLEAQPVIGLMARKEILYRRSALASPRTRGVVAFPEESVRRDVAETLERIGVTPEARPLAIAGAVRAASR